MRHLTVFTTERGQRHQQSALAAAPDSLAITMLRQPNGATLLAHLADAVYLISERRGVVDAGIIAAAPGLRLILRVGSLAHDIDLAAARDAGVAVCCWPEGSVIRVAEHTMLQMLALCKNLHEGEAVALAADSWGESRRTDEDTFAYNWSGRRGSGSLWRRTVGILGLGEIGAELARRLRGWDSTVLYHKRQRLPVDVEADLGVTYVEAEALYARSDFLVNLLPYSPANDLSIGAAIFEQMKDGAYLVSCGSGSVIDEAALADAIHAGKLAGAALDTFEWEPLRPDNPLLALARQGANVLLTPHMAAGGANGAGDERLAMYTPILDHLAGRPLSNRMV